MDGTPKEQSALKKERVPVVPCPATKIKGGRRFLSTVELWDDACGCGCCWTEMEEDGVDGSIQFVFVVVVFVVEGSISGMFVLVVPAAPVGVVVVVGSLMLSNTVKLWFLVGVPPSA